MPLASYNPGSPAGMDQWSIENTLAPLAVGGSQSEAQMMLGNYQNERAAANSQYASNLDQEHLFAYQQLAQQMKEAYLKETPNYAKEGLLPVLMGTNPAALAGADPAALDLANQTYYQTAAAKNAQAGATALNQGSQGGYQMDPNLVPGVAGTTVGPYRGPALAQAATIRANAQMASAALNANKPEKTTVSTVGAPNAAGDVSTLSTRTTAGNEGRVIQQHDTINQGIRDARSGNNATSLQPNTAPSPSSGGGGAQQIDTNSPIGKAAQGAATRLSAQLAADPTRKGDAADIRGGMTGNVFPSYVKPNGDVVARGKSGKEFFLGKAQ